MLGKVNSPYISIYLHYFSSLAKLHGFREPQNAEGAIVG